MRDARNALRWEAGERSNRSIFLGLTCDAGQGECEAPRVYPTDKPAHINKASGGGIDPIVSTAAGGVPLAGR